MKLKMFFWSFCSFCAFITYFCHDDSTIWNENPKLLNNSMISIIIINIIIVSEDHYDVIQC